MLSAATALVALALRGTVLTVVSDWFAGKSGGGERRGGARLTERQPVNMVTHMKTTVDIADDLLLRAKREAEASQTTLRSLIEEGLREVLGRKASSTQKPIKPVTFRGRGLQPEFRGKGWDAIRDAIYRTAES